MDRDRAGLPYAEDSEFISPMSVNALVKIEFAWKFPWTRNLLVIVS